MWLKRELATCILGGGQLVCEKAYRHYSVCRGTAMELVASQARCSCDAIEAFFTGKMVAMQLIDFAFGVGAAWHRHQGQNMLWMRRTQRS